MLCLLACFSHYFRLTSCFLKWRRCCVRTKWQQELYKAFFLTMLTLLGRKNGNLENVLRYTLKSTSAPLCESGKKEHKYVEVTCQWKTAQSQCLHSLYASDMIGCIVHRISLHQHMEIILISDVKSTNFRFYCFNRRSCIR